MESIVTVSLNLRLDVAAIRDRADLATWAKILGVGADPDKATWDDVYEELAKVLVGSEHYSKFSATAISDLHAFAKMVRTSEIRVHHSDLPDGRPTLKMVPPPPPAPRKSPAKA